MNLKPIVFLDLDDTLNNFTETVCKLRKVPYNSIQKYEDLFPVTKLTYNKLARLVNSNKYLELIKLSEVAQNMTNVLSLYKDEIIIKIITARKYLGEGGIGTCKNELWKLSELLGNSVLYDSDLIVCEREMKAAIILSLARKRSFMFVDDNNITHSEVTAGVMSQRHNYKQTIKSIAPAPWNRAKIEDFNMSTLNQCIIDLLGN